MGPKDFEQAHTDINEEGDVLPSDEPDALGYTGEIVIPDHAYAGAPDEATEDAQSAHPTPTKHESEMVHKRIEKMKHALAVYGFLPKSYAELHYLSEYDLHGGASEMMEVILSHQANLRSNRPDSRVVERTERAILEDIRGYSKDSAHAASFLLLFDEFLDNYDDDLKQKVADLPMIHDREWIHEGWMRRGIVEMQSISDGMKLARGEVEMLPKVENYFKRDKEVIDKLSELPQSLTIEQMKALIAEGIAYHQARRKLWTAVIEEIEMSQMGKYSVKGAVQAAKDVMGVDASLTSEGH